MRDFNVRNLDYEKRAAKFAGSDGTVTPEIVEKLVRNSTDCYYCGNRVNIRKRTLDHVVPITRFGVHSVTNLVMACPACNTQKGCLTGEEYTSVRNRLMEANNTLTGIRKGEKKIQQIIRIQNKILKYAKTSGYQLDGI